MARCSFVGFAAQAIGATATLANSQAAFQQYCESFNASTSSISGVSLASTYSPARTDLQLNEVDATCGIFTQAVTVSLCRVVGQVSTSDRSGFWFEAWLPEDWSGRFLATGNGGPGGCIQYYDVEYGASLGFATIATNNGH